MCHGRDGTLRIWRCSNKCDFMDHVSEGRALCRPVAMRPAWDDSTITPAKRADNTIRAGTDFPLLDLPARHRNLKVRDLDQGRCACLSGQCSLRVLQGSPLGRCPMPMVSNDCQLPGAYMHWTVARAGPAVQGVSLWFQCHMWKRL